MEHLIGVFCASRSGGESFVEAARETGRLLGERGFGMIYGGGKVGLMGVMSQSVRAAGGKVVGVIPELLMAREVADREADELLVTKDLYERKEAIIARASAFITLPGGFGTLDELMEVITLKQLQIHRNPIYLLNHRGFYDQLMTFFDLLGEAGYVPESYERYYRLFDTPAEMIDALVSDLA